MNFCSNPNSLISINLNELIGKSLNSINANFSILKEQICQQENILVPFLAKNSLFENQVLTLSSELIKKSFAEVVFEGNGNILKQNEIFSVQKISFGEYHIIFSSLHDNFLFTGSLVSSSLGFINSTSETSTSLTIKTRLLNGNLFEPEKISLVFF